MYTHELVIVWSNGDLSVYPYKSKADAERGEESMRMANGNQIEWSCVRQKIWKRG